MSNLPTCKILDIPIFNGSIDDMIDRVIHTKDVGNRCVSFSGAHGLVISKNNKIFEQTLRSFYCNMPDGMPLVWRAKLKGAKKIKRCFGPEFYRKCMKETANKNMKHFFCGSTKEILEKLRAKAETTLGNHHVVGTYAPSFCAIENYNYRQIAEQINKTKADIVWIGISTPKQEQFALKLSKYTKVKYLFTVGAAFDYHTNPKIKYAPKWMKEAGLEWAFRLYMEPRRLWKRYASTIPQFIFYILCSSFK